MRIKAPIRSTAAARAAWTLGLAALAAGTSLAATQASTSAGWVLADQPAATSPYAADPSYSYNSTGGAITITPSGTGIYQVSFAGLAAATSSNALATAVNTNGYCTIDSWGGSAGGPMNAYVDCFDATGAPANAAFTLVYQARYGPTGDAGKQLAFLWANQPTAASYTPAPTGQYNSTGASNTMVRHSVGSYTATLPGLKTIGGHVEVTAFSGAPARCKVAAWSQDTVGTHADILCFDKAGAPLDVDFNLAYVKSLPVAFMTTGRTNGFYAWAQRPAGATYVTSATYSYNSDKSGRISSTNTAKGVYAVQVPALADYLSSTALATAYGTSSDYCNVKGWYPIQVTCFSQGGRPHNSQFNVSYTFH